MKDYALNVKPLPERTRDDKVFNVEVTFNLGKSAQGRILTDFPQSMEESEFAEKLDMLDRQARRQQARYRLEELEEELFAREEQLAQWHVDLGEAEKAYQATKARLEEEIRQIDGSYTTALQHAANDHAQSGRRGPFEPRGSQKRIFDDQYARPLKLKNDELEKQKAERTQARGVLETNIKNHEKLIAKLKAKIEKTRELLGKSG